MDYIKLELHLQCDYNIPSAKKNLHGPPVPVEIHLGDTPPHIENECHSALPSFIPTEQTQQWSEKEVVYEKRAI